MRIRQSPNKTDGRRGPIDEFLSCSVIMMCQQDITLEIPERIFETDQRGLPFIDDLKVRDHFVEIFIPMTLVVAPKRTGGVVYFGFIIVNARYQNDCDSMVGPRFLPLVEERGEERMYDLLVVTFPITSKLPQFLTNLNENCDLGGERPVYGFRRCRYTSR